MVAALSLTAAPAQADEVYVRSGSTVTLSGHGYGHGHGMSQWGAYGAARQGRTWQQITSFYYPGTKLVKLANRNVRVRLDLVSHTSLYLPTPAGLRLAGATLPGTIAGARVTRYRARSRAAGGLEVHGLTAAGWRLFRNVASPAVFTSSSGKVNVLLSSGVTRAYRGSIYANRASSSSITPVSVLPMESYLRSVVSAEIPASWHPNAVRAQAVAARSYASFDRANATPGRTWDTCDSTCQMYSGVPAEKAASDAAIAATAGQTVTYGGKAAFTQFGAANGGYSASGGRPYLAARADPYDGVVANSAHSWTASISAASIQARWPAIGTYRQLRITRRDGHGQWGGRVLTAVVTGSARSVTVTGTTLRSAFGLKSEWFIPTNSLAAASPRDFSGDRLPDVLAVVAGTGALRLCPGNGASGWRPVRVIGTGFGSLSKVLTGGTWNADSLPDVIGQSRDGTLWLYPGTASGRLGHGVRIGTRWGGYNLVIPVGDFSGDGHPDLMARAPDGRLVLYSGNGRGGFLRSARVGHGWNVFTSVFSPGDFNGDRRADVIARTSGGLLYLYPGNGSGGWLPPRRIGQGWNAFSAIISPGDFNGDGTSDLLARGRDGTLRLYAGNGAGGIGRHAVVGAGWNAFSVILP